MHVQLCAAVDCMLQLNALLRILRMQKMKGTQSGFLCLKKRILQRSYEVKRIISCSHLEEFKEFHKIKADTHTKGDMLES